MGLFPQQVDCKLRADAGKRTDEAAGNQLETSRKGIEEGSCSRHQDGDRDWPEVVQHGVRFLRLRSGIAASRKGKGGSSEKYFIHNRKEPGCDGTPAPVLLLWVAMVHAVQVTSRCGFSCEWPVR